MRLTIAEDYVRQYGSERGAIRMFAADLMRGDPASFKAGYTRENAVIATAEAFDLDRDTVDAAVA
jgi:hypothetical protein